MKVVMKEVIMAAARIRGFFIIELSYLKETKSIGESMHCRTVHLMPITGAEKI
jgi:hypothetical protein